MAASTVSLISLQTLSPPRASTVSHKAAQSPKPSLAIQTNRRKLLFFSLTAMPVLTAKESACFAEDIGLFGLKKKVRQAEKEAVKLEKEAVKLVKEAEREIKTAEKVIETGVVGFGGAAQAGVVAGPEDIGLFGLRKKVRQAEKEAVKLVKEAEREIKTAEKEIETAEIKIETGVVGFGGLAQAGVVAGAEVVGLLVATSIVNGILAPQK